jgi:hypothetical protein
VKEKRRAVPGQARPSCRSAAAGHLCLKKPQVRFRREQAEEEVAGCRVVVVAEQFERGMPPDPGRAGRRSARQSRRGCRVARRGGGRVRRAFQRGRRRAVSACRL